MQKVGEGSRARQLKHMFCIHAVRTSLIPVFMRTCISFMSGIFTYMWVCVYMPGCSSAKQCHTRERERVSCQWLCRRCPWNTRLPELRVETRARSASSLACLLRRVSFVLLLGEKILLLVWQVVWIWWDFARFVPKGWINEISLKRDNQTECFETKGKAGVEARVSLARRWVASCKTEKINKKKDIENKTKQKTNTKQTKGRKKLVRKTPLLPLTLRAFH